MAGELVLRWRSDTGESPLDLARFFAANVQLEYISAGEVTDDRALDFERWVPDLEAQMTREFEDALHGRGGLRVATAQREGVLAALALVEWRPEARVPHLVLSDLVVDQASRGQGLGTELLEFLLIQARRAGLKGAFLESGVHNERAHRFFERQGFRVCSVQMSRHL